MIAIFALFVFLFLLDNGFDPRFLSDFFSEENEEDIEESESEKAWLLKFIAQVASATLGAITCWYFTK